MARLRAPASLVAAVIAATGCRSSEPRPGSSAAAPGPQAPGPTAGREANESEEARALADLRAFEERRRHWQDIARRPPADTAFGANPNQVAWLPGGARAVGLLGGASSIALLDERGERARAPTPPNPTTLAIDPAGLVWVGGTGSPELAAFRVSGERIERVASFELAGGFTTRALAAGALVLYAADQQTGRVAALFVERDGGRIEMRAQREVGRCGAPIQLARSRRHLVAVCLHDRALVAWPLDDGGAPTGEAPISIRHDGPFWSLAIASDAEVDLIAAGGVEDHPLERQGGGFGYIDSFLYLYELGDRGARRVAEVNLSAAGVVMPKWLELALEPGGARVVTAGYATALFASVWIPRPWGPTGVSPDADLASAPRPVHLGGRPSIETRAFWPGSTGFAAAPAPGRPALAASPLVDSWLVDRGGPDAPELLAAPDAPGAPARSAGSRLGEALLFTTLMAPWNSSEGRESRFTCETCHFEAYGDGRVHYTGRGEVHASTRPLRGLVENRPHFSRALDRTTSGMLHAEFRVANRFGPRDSWFEVRRADVPWLAAFEGVPDRLTPFELRRSLLEFLADFGFESNPAVRGRDRFSPEERAGAEAFRERCAACHRPRLVTDDPDSEVRFERWEELIFSPSGPIVWASPEYRKVGVEPLIHPEGGRTPSLRRLSHKYPYFTNGTAKTLDDVLERSAWRAETFFHDRAPANAERASAAERAALRSFLELL